MGMVMVMVPRRVELWAVRRAVIVGCRVEIWAVRGAFIVRCRVEAVFLVLSVCGVLVVSIISGGPIS